MAARTIVPRLATRAASRFIAPTHFTPAARAPAFITSRPFHRSVISKDVMPESNVSASGPGTADMAPATEVPVISYVDGQRSEEQIQVSKPVTPSGADVQHAASALKQSLTAQLTPTMKKFTLHGKVAVVTG